MKFSEARLQGRSQVHVFVSTLHLDTLYCNMQYVISTLYVTRPAFHNE